MNHIKKEELSKYSKDLLTLYLLSSFNIGQDWDFDQKQAILTYNAKLANNLGNLVNRVVVLALKLSEKSWILDNEYNEIDADNIILFSDVEQFMDSNMKLYDLKSALDDNFKFLDILNKYTDTSEPWKLIKEDEIKTRVVLYTIAEWLRQVWLNLYTFFPKKMWKMFNKLWLENYSDLLENWKLNELRIRKEIFKIKEKWEPLFKRIEIN